MKLKFWLLFALVIASAGISGCTAVVVGGAGALIADEVMEQKNGDDGLF